MKSGLLLTSLMLLSAVQVWSSDQLIYSPEKTGGNTGVLFSIPYAAGIHNGQANELTGVVVTDASDNLISARFEVPIQSLSTNNSTRDCHMREALGIDYTHSAFPDKHVCNGDNLLPETGPDSVVFPVIIFDFKKLETEIQTPLTPGNKVEATVTAVLTIHGQSKEIQVPLKITKNAASHETGTASLNVSARFNVRLADYDVQVKPFKLGPVVIGVGETAQVSIKSVLKIKNP